MTKEIPSATADHDVVIVGLGPTGATLANILGEYGLDVLVLEREESVYPLPRAVHFDDEAMRVFQSIG
ncbi:MAG: FAD-dependent monooxygenase, partial [Rhodobiaceae bacterium]